MIPYFWLSEIYSKLINRTKCTPVIIHSQKYFGDVDLSRIYSKSLLCKKLTSHNEPCNACSSCNLFELGNHPDFFMVSPEATRDELVDKYGFHFDDSSVDDNSDKKLSHVIKIDQIRNLIQSIQIGSHQNGKRVVVIYPSESLQIASANTLLKTLEEPPKNVQFILLTNKLEEILPTIKSRCEIYTITKPNLEDSVNWLRGFSGKTISDDQFQILLRQNSLSPIKVLEILRGNQNPAINFPFFDLHLQPKNMDVLLSKLGKNDLSNFIDSFQKWCLDIKFIQHQLPIRYYPEFFKELESLGKIIDTTSFETFLKELKLTKALKDNQSINLALTMQNILRQYSNLTQKYVN